MHYRPDFRHPALLVAGLLVFVLACTDTATAPPNTGFIEVDVVTGGETLDSDGYSVAFRGKTEQTKFVAINGTLPIQLEEGVHEVELLDVAANCEVAGDNPRAVAVVEGETVRVTFEVTCAFVLREIAFSRTRDGCSTWSWECNDLYVVGANGVAETWVTRRADYDDRQPTWSPDGTRLAFVRDDDSGGSIYIVATDGSGLTRLTQGALDRDPAWSPDGSRIAFARAHDGTRRGAIYTVSVDGSDLRELSGGSGHHGDPTWSPDGSRIAFSSYGTPDGSWQSDIYVMDADGSNPVRLTSDPGNDLSPAWSPDGSRIAFASRRATDEDLEIYVMDADGLSSPRRLHSTPGDDRDPTWSPDGSRIAFSGLVDDSSNDWDVYVMAVDGTNVVNITDRPGYDGSPAWRP